jgi:hypothetical protein
MVGADDPVILAARPVRKARQIVIEQRARIERLKMIGADNVWCRGYAGDLRDQSKNI